MLSVIEKLAPSASGTPFVEVWHDGGIGELRRPPKPSSPGAPNVLPSLT